MSKEPTTKINGLAEAAVSTLQCEILGKRWPAVPVFFATTDGHTALIAERLSRGLRQRGIPSIAVDLGSEGIKEREWAQVQGVILCASVHVGGHQNAARSFVRRFRVQLTDVPSLFISVCLAIRSKNQVERDAAIKNADAFGQKTGWVPDRVACVAGKLAYTRYGWFKRSVMKRIARAEGGSTDTSKDHDYTDWEQVDQLGEDFARRLIEEKGVEALRSAYSKVSP